MDERIVMNTGPLIALARIDALEIIGSLPFGFVAPAEVCAELRAGEQQGHLPAIPGWLRECVVGAPLSAVAVSLLDAGEAAVIQLALEQNISRVCIDEWKGRRAACSAGLNVIGTLGLIGLAKARHIIPAMRPYVEKALAVGIYYDLELLEEVLQAAGE
ncbi:MAG TPA: DUF3368 domain-containing protein [Candidatus Hydrogenedentes bacterium]|nr:DUF3368 domain-containing protein [Candidatus Hydrogenedentota bacterium]